MSIEGQPDTPPPGQQPPPQPASPVLSSYGLSQQPPLQHAVSSYPPPLQHPSSSYAQYPYPYQPGQPISPTPSPWGSGRPLPPAHPAGIAPPPPVARPQTMMLAPPATDSKTKDKEDDKRSRRRDGDESSSGSEESSDDDDDDRRSRRKDRKKSPPKRTQTAAGRLQSKSPSARALLASPSTSPTEDQSSLPSLPSPSSSAQLVVNIAKTDESSIAEGDQDESKEKTKKGGKKKELSFEKGVQMTAPSGAPMRTGTAPPSSNVSSSGPIGRSQTAAPTTSALSRVPTSSTPSNTTFSRVATTNTTGKTFTAQPTIASMPTVHQPAGTSDEHNNTCNAILLRLLLAGLSVTLIWVTSLSVCTTLSQAFLPAPTSDQIFDTWSNTATITKQESLDHYSCAVRELAQCSSYFNTSATKMESDNRALRAKNTILVNAAQHLNSDCVTSFNQMTDAVTAFLKNPAYQIAYYPTNVCPTADRQQVDDMFQSLMTVNSNAYIANQQFVKATSDVLSVATSSANNYTQYNKDYIERKIGNLTSLQNVINALSGVHIPNILGDLNPLSGFINQFASCLSLEDNGCGQQSIVAAFRAQLNTLTQAYSDLRDAFQVNINAATAYVNGLLQQMSVGAAFLNLIGQYYTDIKTAVNTVPWPDIPSLQVLSILELTPLPWPPVSIPDIGSFFALRMPSFKTNLLNQIAGMTAALRADLTGWGADIAGQFPSAPHWFDDYNPPPLTTGSVEITTLSTGFLAKSAALLALPVPSSLSNINVSLPSISSLFNKAVSTFDFRSAISFKTKFYTNYTNVQFVDMFYAVQAILLFALIIDNVYRAYRTFRELINFMSRSATWLPTIDVRQFKTKTTVPTSILVAQLLTNSWLIYGAIGAIAIFGLWPAAFTYIPFYKAYMNGCVYGSNGTVISNNLNTFAYNYAALDGNTEITVGLDLYGQRLLSECTKMTEEASTQNTQDSSNYQSAYLSFEDHSTKMELTKKCVDWDASGMPDPVAFQAAYQLQHPRLTLDQATSCYLPIGAGPADASFNCSALPPCVITCPGPNEAVIQYSTFQTGCRSEWLIHSMILRTFLAVLIYFCMNISRVQLITALCRLQWRALTPDGFTYVASCSRSGRTTVGVKKNLKKEVDISVKSFERAALLMFIVALVIHIPYLTIMYLIDPSGFV